MNLTLRGLANVRILLRNVLTTTLAPEQRAELGVPQDGYHVVLANPPFAGRLDRDRIVDEVRVGTSTATELLFLKYMMDSLRPGGRCGVVVPEGVLFGSTGAHKELRRQLIENNRVDAVLSLPAGVFQPYSGVKTSVLFFRKGGATDRVMQLITMALLGGIEVQAHDIDQLVFKARLAREFKGLLQMRLDPVAPPHAANGRGAQADMHYAMSRAAVLTFCKVELERATA